VAPYLGLFQWHIISVYSSGTLSRFIPATNETLQFSCLLAQPSTEWSQPSEPETQINCTRTHTPHVHVFQIKLRREN
jgi:hypothetical protein